MKRKSIPAQAPVSIEVAQANTPSSPVGLLDRCFPWIFPVILFFSMTLQNTVMSLILAGLTLVLSIGKAPAARFCARLSLPVWSFLAFLVLNLAASLYANFGEYAYGEFSKLLASGSLALLLLTRGRKETIRPLLWGFSGVCSLISLLCLDMACKGPLFNGFAKVMAALGDTNYVELGAKITAVARVDGIYNNANISGSLFALAVLVGVYLIHTGATRKARFFACMLTGISSVGFLTSVSRAAMLSLAVSALVYLLIVGKEERFFLFFTFLTTAVSMGIFGVLSLLLLTDGSLLGTWVAVPCGAVLWLLDEFPGRKLAVKLAGHIKAMLLAFAVLVCLCAAGIVAALSMTEPFVFEGENSLYRGVDVVSGETYTITGDWDTDNVITVLVTGGTLDQELTDTLTQIYYGPLEGATFTVPEGVTHLLMRFWCEGGVEIRSLSLSDGTEIPLKYTLLPDNIADRLQKNLFQDNSFLLRVQYVKDGWALFLQSPLFGHGLGATEGLLTSVQPFFYESLYLHNHLLQVMTETGLVGLAAFLGLMCGCAWLMLRYRKTGERPLVALLLSCWVMMNVHGLMEISFSIRMYQCAAFFLLMLMVVVGKPPVEKQRKAVVGVAGVCVAALWILVSGGLLASSMMAQYRLSKVDLNTVTASAFIKELEKADALDFYRDQDIKVNLMGNALQQGGLLNEGTASRCARELRETGDFDACYQVAAYYYLPLRNLSEFFACVQEGLSQERSNPDAWNSAFNLYLQAFSQLSETDMEAFVNGVVATGEQLDQANDALLIDVTLDEQNQVLLNAAQSIQQQQLDEAAAYLVLQGLL